MQWFEDLKISEKLRVWVGLIITLVVALVIGVSFSVITIFRNFAYLENYPRQRSQLAVNINVHFMNIQQYLARMSVYAGFPEEVLAQERLRFNILTEIDAVSVYFGYYMQSIESDPSFSSLERQMHQSQLNEAMSYFELWESLVVHPVITANIASNRARVVELYNWHTYFFDSLIQSFAVMNEEALLEVSEGISRVYSSTIIFAVIFIALSIVVVVVCISFPVIIVRLEGERSANKSKSVFLANMSHEIRTPISVVLGISEVQLQNTTLPPHINESFTKIHKSARLLLGIVNDVLDFSKLDDNKMALVKEEYELENMISYVAGLHTSYDKKNIVFSLIVDESLPARLIGDPLRVEQIIINLLSNAFKYTSDGVVELSWKMQNDALVVCVSDTGMGMSKEQLKTIHEKYTRFHENQKSNIQGTGLGMSIVYKLARLMNAEITIKSELNLGTSVLVTIPQEVPDSAVLGWEAAERLQRFEAQKVNIGFGFEPEPMPYGRVLVVDDIEENLYVAQGLLALYSIDVETCGSGRQAVEKIRNGNVYDIVFMDHMMPEMDGVDTMHAMRELGYHHPVIVLTANALVGHDTLLIKCGFDDFLSKPIIVKNMDNLLVKHIKSKQPPEVIEQARNAPRPTHAENVVNISSHDSMVTKLRIEFARKYGNIYTEMMDAISEGDSSTAHRLAHTLKGLAELIHEKELSKAAETAERLFEKEQTPSSDELEKIERELKRVLEEIRAENPASPTKLDRKQPAEIIPLLEKLKPLLEQQKGDCLEMVDELGQIPETLLISRQVQRFQFANALVSMNALMEILKET